MWRENAKSNQQKLISCDGTWINISEVWQIFLVMFTEDAYFKNIMASKLWHVYN